MSVRCLLPGFLLVACLAGIGATGPGALPRPAALISFLAADPTGKTPPARIVVQHDPATGTGYDLQALLSLNPQMGFTPEACIIRAARYLQEGIRRMTGQEPALANDRDLSHGIILTTLAGAPASVRTDPEVLAALRNTGEDAYNANEAFFLRSEKTRLLIVANTPYGLADAVVEVLEAVDYEVLGMGPQWVSVPDYTHRPLTFSLKRAGRPGYYMRWLFYPATYQIDTGNLHGVPLTDPEDESYDRTHERWTMGARFTGQSMPFFPGHALQSWHPDVVAHMRKTGCREGFLVDDVIRGLTADMPETGQAGRWQLWFSTDPDEFPTSDAIYRAYGDKWRACHPVYDMGFSIDLSVPWVRQIILSAVKKQAAQDFAARPDDLVIIDTEPEDGGGYIDVGKRMRYRNWYPDYLKQEGLPFGRPYALQGWRGIVHPKESWDPDSAADTVFGFKNWILHELDKWIDALPARERLTATGKAKKTLLRNSGYSYAYHDIPPNFNLDQRVRIQIAGFAKHRGQGKWKGIIDSHEDAARAFKVMLPREPSGDYRIMGTDTFYKNAITGVQPFWDQSTAAIHADLQQTYAAGIKALSYETEYAFGRNGLGYYLMSKMLWNPRLTVRELDALRDRWFQRAFGSAAAEMKAYYDFMLLKNYPRNMPSTWAQAIRLIDAADRKLEGTTETVAQRRIDDLKVFWYYHYLLDSNVPAENPEEIDAQLDRVQEFAWKGQMAHTVHMFRAVPGLCGTKDTVKAAGAYANGPAHYTHEEVSDRWQQVLDFWKPVPVDQFAETTLANGVKGSSVDLNDLVMVNEFNGGPPEGYFYDNSYYVPSTQFLTVARTAGETIGFKFFWPTQYNKGLEVHYGLERWNAPRKAWEILLDKARTKTTGKILQIDWASGLKGEYELVEVRVTAANAGTYRFDLGPGGVASGLSSLNLDVASGRCDDGKYPPHSYTALPGTITQSGIYLYIPKGTRSIDLDVWDTFGGKSLTLFKGLPATGMRSTRKVDIAALGTHRVPLQPGEDGSIALIEQNGFAPPVCYSIPGIWAKSPSALYVPRGIALADGLSVIGTTK